MTNTIKALETFYDGHHFRSRIEARWAVFFNTLGIKYEYEKEGYELDGLYYLPDFWIPHLQCWVEIKGARASFAEWTKCERLVYTTGRPCYVFFGDIPNPEDLEIIYGNPELGATELSPINDSHWSEEKNTWVSSGNVVAGHDNGYMWCECPSCGGVGIEFGGRSDRLQCKNRFAGSCPKSAHGDRGHNYCTERLCFAYWMARMAQFKPGEMCISQQLWTAIQASPKPKVECAVGVPLDTRTLNRNYINSLKGRR